MAMTIALSADRPGEVYPFRGDLAEGVRYEPRPGSRPRPRVKTTPAWRRRRISQSRGGPSSRSGRPSPSWTGLRPRGVRISTSGSSLPADHVAPSPAPHRSRRSRLLSSSPSPECGLAPPFGSSDAGPRLAAAAAPACDAREGSAGAAQGHRWRCPRGALARAADGLLACSPRLPVCARVPVYSGLSSAGWSPLRPPVRGHRVRDRACCAQ